MGKYFRFLLIIFVLVSAGFIYFRSRPPQPRPSPHVNRRNAQASSHQDSNEVSDAAELEKLASLPYTNWGSATTEIHKAGVTQFEQDKTFRGLNLYHSRNLSLAYLMDMGGKVVHKWSVPQKPNSSWHSIQMMQNGDLFAIVEDQKLIRLAWNSRVLWEHPGRFHHDLAISPDGLVYICTRRAEMWNARNLQLPVIKEYITVLDGNGKFIRRIDLFGALSPFLSERQIEKVRILAASPNVRDWLKKDREMKDSFWFDNRDLDVFHLNAIEIIDRDIPGIAQKGDFLFSVRQLNLICIYRESIGKIVWSWGPDEIQCQHHARLLDNHHLLLFDNGCKRGYSRVIELDPSTKRIVWEYKTSGEKKLFSFRRGGVQRLPNGNTLITESDRGRAIEVTPDRKIVWEFFNPDIQKERNRRAIIYRMARVPTTFINQNLTK